MIADEEIAYQQREDLLKSALDKKLLTLQEYQMLEREVLNHVRRTSKNHEAETQ
jgi:transcriptional regulator CtsR